MALKTNSKKARENVRGYIVEYAREYLADDYGIETNTEHETLKEVYNVFVDEWKPFSGYNARRSPFDNFEDYAGGLPLGGLFCYYYNRNAVDDLGAILEETEEEKARFTEEQAAHLLTLLIWREVEKEASK